MCLQEGAQREEPNRVVKLGLLCGVFLQSCLEACSDPMPAPGSNLLCRSPPWKGFRCSHFCLVIYLWPCASSVLFLRRSSIAIVPDLRGQATAGQVHDDVAEISFPESLRRRRLACDCTFAALLLSASFKLTIRGWCSLSRDLRYCEASVFVNATHETSRD